MEDLIKALRIFLKYNMDTYPSHCEHGILRINVNPKIVNDGDIKLLSDLGFFPDNEFNCFASRRYGSISWLHGNYSYCTFAEDF